MKKTVKVDKKNNTVSVTIEIAKRKLASQPVVNIRTRDVLELLREDGISFLKTCLEECTLSNEQETSVHKGTWVFAIPQEAKKEPKKTKKTAQNKENSKKQAKTTEATPKKTVFTRNSSFPQKTVDNTLPK